MPLNTAYLKWGMRRLIAGRTRDLQTMAARSWEICPGETTQTPAAIYLPEALDRITDLSPWRDWETEKRLVQGCRAEHAASRAYLIENVDLAGAFLYRKAGKAQPGFGRQKIFRSDNRPIRHISEAHLVSNWAGSHYFGNFLRDDMPLGLLPAQDDPKITVETKPYHHEAGYRQLLSLPPPPRISAARIDRLIMYSDFAQNASKAGRYAELRQRLRRNIGATGTEGRTGVYLKRGATGERRIVANEAEMEATLADLGFDIVDSSALDAQAVARRMLDAPIVVSVEGSHLAHAMYSVAENGAFLVLQPPDRFAMVYKEFADRMDLRFAFVVGYPAEGGFTVGLNDLKKTLDLLP